MTEEKRKEYDELIKHLNQELEDQGKYRHVVMLTPNQAHLILGLLKEIGVTEPEKEIE